MFKHIPSTLLFTLALGLAGCDSGTSIYDPWDLQILPEDFELRIVPRDFDAEDDELTYQGRVGGVDADTINGGELHYLAPSTDDAEAERAAITLALDTPEGTLSVMIVGDDQDLLGASDADETVFWMNDSVGEDACTEGCVYLHEADLAGETIALARTRVGIRHEGAPEEDYLLIVELTDGEGDTLTVSTSLFARAQR